MSERRIRCAVRRPSGPIVRGASGGTGVEIGRMTYREPEPSVRVELRPSSVWLRLRIELQGVRLGAKVIWSLPVPAALTLVASWAYRDEPIVIVGFFLASFLAFFLGRTVPTLLAAAARAMVRRVAELDLPRALVFRASGIRVEPAEGEAYERRWPYFHEARRVLRGVEIVLSREPYLVFAVPRSTLRGKDFATLEGWLVENELLRARRSLFSRPRGAASPR
jgi:hypothetical protein